MKKFTLTLLTLIVASSFIHAGGLVTNTNQSTAWTRMLVRDASIDIDAVFYNPAGLTKLKDGFHISISNQSLFQKQTITSGYPYLNDPEYVGNISAPLFPSVYLAYKTGRWAFSLGFNSLNSLLMASTSKSISNSPLAFENAPIIPELTIPAFNPTSPEIVVTSATATARLSKLYASNGFGVLIMDICIFGSFKCGHDSVFQRAHLVKVSISVNA